MAKGMVGEVKADREISMEEFRGAVINPVLAKMKIDIERLREMSDLFKEHTKVQAGITKAKYDALVEEGFTPQQAIDLCRSAL